ncbi:serrate RNA effector molecule homolog A-like [Aricia agestis]|uniref:serrate RNA effector molecule homolog A-like n=1 Tax=Aricia agestis TaxID=91739 RepID=UPI001C209760|nr:serrate RNA effector molecule homolog A-like [Aricia agestis]
MMLLSFLIICLFTVTTNASDVDHGFAFESFFPNSCETLDIEVECTFCESRNQSFMLTHKKAADPPPLTPLSPPRPPTPPSPSLREDTKKDNGTTEPDTKKENGTAEPDTNKENRTAQPDTNKENRTAQPDTKKENGTAESDTEKQNGTAEPDTEKQNGTAEPDTKKENGTAEPGPINVENDHQDAEAHTGGEKVVHNSPANVILVVVLCLIGSVGAFMLANFITKKISVHQQSGTYQVSEQGNSPI